MKNATDQLKNDREIVMEAVKSSTASGALQWVSDEIKNDRKIVLAAIQHAGCEVIQASDDLKKDNEFLLAALAYNTKQRFEEVIKRMNDCLKLMGVQDFMIMT